MSNDLEVTRYRVTCTRCASTRIAKFGTVVVNRGCQDVNSSISLDPFAPPALPGLNAHMGPLTPEQPALRTGRFRTFRNPAHEHRPVIAQVSLLIAFDLQTIPSPTTDLPFRLGRFVTLHHRRDLPRLSPRQTSWVGGNAVARSRVRASLGASPTGLAESSSQKLRTGRSSQVALHLASQQRSYHFRLQAGNVSLERTSTFQIKRLHRRTRRRLLAAGGHHDRRWRCRRYVTRPRICSVGLLARQSSAANDRANGAITIRALAHGTR